MVSLFRFKTIMRCVIDKFKNEENMRGSENFSNKFNVTCDKIDDKPHDTHSRESSPPIQSIRQKMTKFRPCIDLHSGQVKQIVGGTLSTVAADLKTNYVSKLPASHYAGLYQKHDLRGGTS